MTSSGAPYANVPAEPAWGVPSAPAAAPAAVPGFAAPAPGAQTPATHALAVALIQLPPGQTYPGPLVANAGKRIGAFLLDTVAAWAVTAVGLLVGIAAFGNGTGAVPALGFGLLGLYFLVLVIVVGRTGRTVGKAILGLRVVNETSLKPVGFGAALVRGLLIFPLSLFLIWLLLLVISTLALDKSGRNQGWHDKAARSIVVDTRRGTDPVVDGQPAAAPLARAV
ncbi:RDD family protein [Homoserinimonas sp. OAct 916]|uniref:RDD family protein n=1 Tax=Homoserinimonas sp. OAct 916 TaxID=2211450 RepID=UPI001300AC0F|nr:RDD family protein [Homoserinimonas sp. OAct 916]